MSAAPFTVEGLHHVQLAMPPGGEPEAQRFYGDVLMFDEVAKPEHLAAAGRLLVPLGTARAAPGGRGGLPGVGEGAPGRAGARPRRVASPTWRPPASSVETDTDLDGHERWYVRDPFGNRLEFIEQVAR